MKKWKKRALFIACAFAFILLISLILYLSPPKFIFERRLPLYAKELPENFAAASSEFKQRVRAQFHTPIDISLFLSKLSNEGFEVHSDHNFAQIKRNKFPCAYVWMITCAASKSLISRSKDTTAPLAYKLKLLIKLLTKK